MGKHSISLNAAVDLVLYGMTWFGRFEVCCTWERALHFKTTFSFTNAKNTNTKTFKIMPRCHAIQTRNAKINAKFSHLYTQYSKHIADGLHHLNSIGFTCVFISNLELIFMLFACVGALVCSCISLMNKKRNKQINRIKLFTQFTVDVLQSSFFAWYLNSNAV